MVYTSVYVLQLCVVTAWIATSLLCNRNKKPLEKGKGGIFLEDS